MGRIVFFLAFLQGAAIILALPAVGLADIYRYVDANGVTHFTDNPTVSHYSIYLREQAQEVPLRDLVTRYAGQFRLEAALINAVIKVESDHNPRAISRKGAQGLMQLMPQTARELQVKDPLNPEENIRAGTRYLRMMLDRFGDLDLALAAYNAGPSAVASHGGIPPYEETRNYVERVKKYLRHYRQRKDTLL